MTSEPDRPGRDGTRYRKKLRNLFERADRLLAVSDFIGRRLCELGAPPDKIVVHHLGTKIVPVDPASDRCGVLFVGRLRAQKGPQHLLSAVTRLPEELRRGLPIRIAGFGELAPTLREQAARDHLDVTFLGRLDSTQIAHELDRASIFCAPSVRVGDGAEEGFGLVYLEAALHGLPVLAYRHGGVAEAVLDGRTGLLAEDGDIDALLEQPTAPNHRFRLGLNSWARPALNGCGLSLTLWAAPRNWSAFMTRRWPRPVCASSLK